MNLYAFSSVAWAFLSHRGMIGARQGCVRLHFWLILIHWNSWSILSFSVGMACLLLQYVGSCLISLKNNDGKACYIFPNAHSLIRPIWWAKKFLTWKVILSCRCQMSFPFKIILFWNSIARVWVGWGLGKTCLLAPSSESALREACPGALWNVGSKVFRKNPIWAQVSVKLLTYWNLEVTVTAVIGSMRNNLFLLKPQGRKGKECLRGAGELPQMRAFPLPIPSCWTGELGGPTLRLLWWNQGVRRHQETGKWLI